MGSEKANQNVLHKDHGEWDVHLPEIEIAIWNTVHLATGETPFFTVFGHYMFLNGASYKLRSNSQPCLVC